MSLVSISSHKTILILYIKLQTIQVTPITYINADSKCSINDNCYYVSTYYIPNICPKLALYI